MTKNQNKIKTILFFVPVEVVKTLWTDSSLRSAPLAGKAALSTAHLHCSAPAHVPSTQPADRPGTMNMEPSLKRPLLLVRLDGNILNSY